MYIADRIADPIQAIQGLTERLFGARARAHLTLVNLIW